MNISKMIDNILIRVIIHATEDEKIINEIFNFLFSCLNKKEKYIISSIDTVGYYGNPIKVNQYKLSNRKDCNIFINFLSKNITKKDKKILISDIKNRLDENLNFYIRFNKQELVNKILKLENINDSILIKLKIITYPKSYKKA